MVIKNLQIDSMFKKGLIAFSMCLFVMLIAGSAFSHKAFAKTCEEDYLKGSPGGEVPPTDPNTISNCSSLSSRSGTAVPNASCPYKISPFTVTFCDQGTPITSFATGEVRLYVSGAHYKVNNIRGNAYTGDGTVNDVGTGVLVNSGEYLYTRLGEYNNTDGRGWRAIISGNGFADAAVSDATSKGYTVISKQFWADAVTSSLYDSYDFDDIVMVVAIKQTALACGASGCNSVACAAGNSCNGNVCQIDCAAGYFRSGNCACIAECQNTDVTLSSNPSNVSPLILGANTTVSLIRTGTVSLSRYAMSGNTQSPVNAFGCNWADLNGVDATRSVTCSVDRKPAYPNTLVTWTHSWCNTDNGSCAGKKVCSTSLPLNINPYGAYLRTDFGSLYIRGNLSMPRFPVASQKISSYNYSTAGTNTPIGTSWLSAKNYLLLGYSDSNGRADFFAYIKSRLGVDARISPTLGTTTLTNANYAGTVGSYNVVNVNGDLTLSGASCNSKTIFFVTGNLIVTSNFDISGDNACMFVVGATVGKGTIVNSAVTSFRAFVITDAFTSQLGNAQLILNGGLVVQTANTYDRNINLYVTEASLINRTTPSELLSYEGARYLKHLGELLSEPTTFDVREIQYTGVAP